MSQDHSRKFIKVKLVAPTDKEDVFADMEGVLNVGEIISAAALLPASESRPRFGVKMSNSDYFIIVEPGWDEFVKSLGAVPWNEIH